MRIHALRLQARNPDAVGAFYESAMGLDVERTATGVAVTVGRSELVFEACTGDDDPFYHFAITVPRNRFDDAYDWLDDRVGLLPDVETGQTRFEFGALLDATACYFRDPAGNIGELIARHRLDTDADDDSFGSRHLLELSEIGLVVDDVPSTTANLVESTGVTDLGGGPAFRMVGDRRAAFIVVDEDRPWFVGGDDPGVFPTAVDATIAADYTFEDRPYRLRRA